MKRRHHIAALTASASMLTLLTVVPSMAQQAGEEIVIEEIIVTSQKRAEKAQDVPITLTTFSSKSLDTTGAQTIADLDRLTPGFDVSATSPTQPRFSMRGISTNDFSSGVEPAVGVFIDGIYAARSGSAIVFFDDIERVEILKGPQGTLFGRNTSAGAVSIITTKPKLGETSFKTKLTYGNFDKKRALATANIAMGDSFAVRINGVYNRRDGYYKDALTGERWSNEASESFRAAARYQPMEGTTIDFSWDHDWTHQYARYLIGFGPFSPNGVNMKPPYRIENDAEDNNETRKLDSFGLTVSHDMGWATLTSVTSHKKFRTTNREDEDGTALFDYYLDTDNQERNKQIYQELRLNGDTGAIKWTAGASYFKEKGRQLTNIQSTTDTVEHVVELQTMGAPCMDAYAGLVSEITGSPFQEVKFLCANPAYAGPYEQLFAALNNNSIFTVLDGLVGPYGMAINGRRWYENVYNTADFEAFAGFADATWNATDSLNLTAGVRWTKDKKTYGWINGRRRLEGGHLATPLDIDYSTLVDMLTDNTDLIMPGVFNLTKTASWTNVSPRFVADYKFTDKIMAFASIAWGYKAGGFNFNQPNSKFAPEKVWNFEGGVKADWLNGALRTNASVFKYLYKDMQEAQLIGAPGNIPAYQINSSDQRAMGFEWEIKATPVRNLVLSVVGGYIDAEWAKRTDFCNGIPYDSAGTKRGGSTTRIALAADYRLNVSDSSDIAIHIDHSMDSKPRQTKASQVCDSVAADDWGIDVTQLPGYNKARNNTNARISFDHESGIGVSLWVQNLTDKRYMGGLGGQASVIGAYTGTWDTPPRTYGVDLNLKF